MAAVDVGARNNPPVGTDELDDLFDYDVPADILRDVDADMEGPNRLAKTPLGHVGKESAGGLGIDEEIKITKKRAPVAKLDENRLLSQAGIPKLRAITKKRLKFKGKGHEYSDVALLLSVYQLWLDDLYPRAKFADGLAMIEKLGHTKRMQAMRKEWIHEGKPKDNYDEQEHSLENPDCNHTLPKAVQHPPTGDNPAVGRHTPTHESWSDDELFRPSKTLSLAAGGLSDEATVDSLFLPNTEGGSDPPLEDDLDALLVEDEIKAKSGDLPVQQQYDGNRVSNDNFDDEMEAMAGLDEMW